MKYQIITVITAALFSLFAGCGADEAFVNGLPKISSFDVQKYMGTWYEVARFQHSFEKDVIRTTANYTLREDGTVRVVNAGVDVNDASKKKEARAVAHLVKGDIPGYLRVSFFRPFYGDYRIIALDEKNYQYALVTSSSRDYLWILSRTKNMEPALYDSLVETARKAGLDVSKIYRVPQD